MESQVRFEVLKRSLLSIFGRLEALRHVRRFDLERRFSPFLLPYLTHAFESFLRQNGYPTLRLRHDILLAEFPYSAGESLVDYVLFSEDGCLVFFVELKTDMGYLKKAQLTQLSSWNDKRFSRLLKDVLTTVSRSGKKSFKKTHHLCYLLTHLGYLRPKPFNHNALKKEDFQRGIEEEPSSGLIPSDLAKSATVHVAWLLPNGHVDYAPCMTFGWLADYLERCHASDELARMLAASLRMIASCDPGETSPDKVPWPAPIIQPPSRS